MNERLKERINNFAGFDRAVPMPLSNTIDNSVPMPTRDTPNNAVPMPSGDSIDPMDRIENFQLIRDIQALGGRLSDAEISMYMNMTPEGIKQVRERENIDQMLNSLMKGTLEKPKNIFDEELKNMSFEDGVELSRKLNRVQPETSTFQQQLRNARMNDLMDALSQNKGSLSDREARYLIENFDVDIDGRDYQFESDGGLNLMRLRQRLGLEPMYDATGTEFDEVTVTPEAEALSMMGRGGDTELAHLEPGDVVIPPQLLDADPMLADVLEERMIMAGVDPTSRVAGMGIASLNPNTGLEEFGFFKKLGKKVKKVVKKVAPYAGIIAAPFTGGLSAALIGAGGGLLSGKGLKGAALGALSGFGANAALGKLGLTASAVKGAGGLLPALKGAGAKIAGGLKGLGSLGGGGGGLGNLLGGGGGLGSLLGGGQGQGMVGGRGGIGAGALLGAGIPALLLAKKAYDEAKADKGIQQTPMNQFDAMGRYNIEAEIARRMGQEQPNPVEFGLLPELPELSGGKPIQQAAYGGPVMAFAEGGNVAMEDFQRMTRDINGAGTETSDDIPAMLSDGEFVMTARSVRGAGAFDMNNEGGIITLVPSMSEDRDRGTELMNQMMDMFSSQATPS